MSQSLLSLKDVSYQINGKPLLKNLSIDIEKDAFTLVLGPNGAGKSLFLRLCHSLVLPTSGQLLWHTNNNLPPRQTMVFQSPVMLRRTALSNITYALQYQPGQPRLEQAMAALAWANLDHLANRSATLLSRGEQQQLALARAWAYRPEVLFLDEPTASLDPNACSRVERLIALIRQQGTQVIMSTHNLAQAQRLGGSVIYIEEGAMVAHQSCDTFFSAPSSSLAAAFINREAMHKEVSH
jgi:tungstate transport system ATP-binding protein